MAFGLEVRVGLRVWVRVGVEVRVRVRVKVSVGVRVWVSVRIRVEVSVSLSGLWLWFDFRTIATYTQEMMYTSARLHDSKEIPMAIPMFSEIRSRATQRN